MDHSVQVAPNQRSRVQTYPQCGQKQDCYYRIVSEGQPANRKNACTGPANVLLCVSNTSTCLRSLHPVASKASFSLDVTVVIIILWRRNSPWQLDFSGVNDLVEEFQRSPSPAGKWLPSSIPHQILESISRFSHLVKNSIGCVKNGRGFHLFWEFELHLKWIPVFSTVQ